MARWQCAASPSRRADRKVHEEPRFEWKRGLYPLLLLLEGIASGMKDSHAHRAGAGPGRDGCSPAIRDGWRNCSQCCLTCTAGWGLVLTGVPGRRGIRNKEAGKPEGPLERRERSGLSSSRRIWRQMFSISPAPKGRKWWGARVLLANSAGFGVFLNFLAD